MKNLLIILIFLATGCTSKHQIPAAQVVENNEAISDIKIEFGENILFTFQNNSEENLFINEPTKLHIERFLDGSWQIVKILPCPCDAPCNAPIEKQELIPGELINLTWNKEESWCGTERVNRVRNTIKQSVAEGTYRIKISILTDEKKINPIYKEFKIN